ncbi:MAG: acyltransferase family protein [Pseudomonadota bacterium]
MTNTRYHYMDNLRATAMLFGVFFHAALAYSPGMQNFWLSASPDNSVVIDVIAWFSHLFRMPLFFLIAGFFGAYLIGKRGIGGYLKNRSLRILLPLLIFLPLTWATMFGPVIWAMENVQNQSPMLGVIAWMTENPDMAPPQQFSSVHLWFLLNLVYFCLAYALLVRFGDKLSALADRLLTPKVIVFLLPLVMVPALATQVQPHPAPEQLEPKLWSFGFYGVFFLLGSYYFRRQEQLEELGRYVPLMLVSSVILYAVFYSQIPAPLSFQEGIALFMAGPELSIREVGLSVLEAYIALHMTLVCLVAGRRFMDKASKPVRYIADSSYWIYLMHLPTVIFIQYLLLDTDWNLWVEFLLSSVGTIVIGLITYAALIRWTPIGWMLNGRRKKVQDDTASPVAA